MTFDQYIQNPMGIKNSVISNREMYRSMYTTKLNTILVRESGKVVYYCYKGKSKYYTYIKVPSEVIPDFYYDVVVEFTPPKDKKITDRTLRNYDVRFYSNDPSFVFTFAHAFIKNGIFIDTFKKKMSSEAVRKNANEKNPNNQVGYVKSLYFAYIIMEQRGLFNKLHYVEQYNEKNLNSMIMEADKKIALRQSKQNELKAKNKRSKAKIKEKEKPSNLRSDETPISHKISNIAHTRKIKSVSKSNKIGKKK